MLQMTRGSNKESRRVPVAVTWLCALSSLGAACESGLVVCLHWLFSLAKSQWRCSIPRCSFRSDVGSVIWCLCQNLYQQRTIIVNLVNVYKVQHLAAGLCSPRLAFLRLCLFFIFLLVFYAFVCLERLCLKSVACGREELRVS